MISFDAYTDPSYVSAVSSQTFAHTVGAGANRILFVGIDVNGGDNITGVTYNGVAMTQLTKVNDGTAYNYLYYLLNPPTGTFNVVASQSSATNMSALAVSYAGVAQSAPEASTNATSSPIFINTLSPNAWAFIYGSSHSNADPSVGGDAITQYHTSGSYQVAGDSGVRASAGTVVFTGVGSAGYVAASIAPFPDGAANPTSSGNQLRRIKVGNGMSRNDGAT